MERAWMLDGIPRRSVEGVFFPTMRDRRGERAGIARTP